MKKFLLSIFCCLMAFASVQAEEYSYTFTSKQFSANGTKTLNSVNWTLAGNGNYWGYDGTKGQQFGSGSAPYKSLTLSTSGIEGTITKIVVNTSGASSVNASFTVSVGGTQYGSSTKLTTSATDYTFTGSASGEIKISYTQTSSKAIYIKSIAVTYESAGSGEGGGETPEAPAAPTLPATQSFENSMIVEITDIVEGATAYYSLNSESNWVAGTSVEITETTTVYAKVVKDELSSGVVSATYTKNEPVTPPAEGEVVDVLNRALTGIANNGGYNTWSGKKSTSDAVYAGQSAGSNDAIQLRSKNNNSGIVTTTSGGKVKKVVVEWQSATLDNRTLNVYGKNSAYTEASDLYDNTKQGTLLGTIVKGTSTTLEISGDYEYIGLRSASDAMYLTSVSITWDNTPSAPKAETPVITPAGGEITADTEITISCATEGAKIYYTIDGSTPTTASTLYSGAFKLAAAATVKAIAVADGVETSSVATAEFTFPVVCENIAAFIAKADLENNLTITGEVVVVAQVGKYLFIQDNSAKILVYGDLEKTYNAGDRLSGIKGKYSPYNGLIEMLPLASSFGEAKEGEAVAPVEMTLAEVAEAELLTYVTISGVTIPEAGAKSCAVTDASGEITMYNTLNIDIPAGVATVTGFASVYNSTRQLMPLVIEIENATPVTDAPSLPASANFENEFEVAITAEEGATIYYTTDGTEPTTESTVYSAPFTISETTTVKAIAVKDDVVSTVAEAKYTKVRVIDLSDCSVADAIEAYTNGQSGDATITGYIVGVMIDNSPNYGAVSEESNLIIADDVNETDPAKCIPVQLSSGTKIREVLNLKNNSGNFGRKVTVVGSLEKYFSRAGLKSLSTAGLYWNVSAAGYATLYLGYKAVIPSTVNAYIVESTNSTHAIMTKVEGVVAANTGLILEGEGEHLFNITTVAATAEVEGNLLKGTVVDENITEDAYVLSDGANGIGLYGAIMNQADGTAWLNNANKAYLPMSAVANKSAEFFGFDWDGTTGISEVTTENGEVKAIYDLTGRKLKGENGNLKGIYIINGKKVLVK